MKIEESAVIERPVAEVFALAADPTTDPLWASTVAEATQTSEGRSASGRRSSRCFGSWGGGS